MENSKIPELIPFTSNSRPNFISNLLFQCFVSQFLLCEMEASHSVIIYFSHRREVNEYLALVSQGFGERMRAHVIGFLYTGDLYPRKSHDSHEYLLVTQKGPCAGHSLGLPFSFP